MPDKCFKALVSGRVQGVFFRDSTRRQAQHLALTGHAINLPDGRVEVIACGSEEQLEQLLAWLHEGPEYAVVNALEVETIDIVKPAAFTIG
ncbi:MAG: acylphosphatase [Gammaproteobacteria bacterium]|nr:acylphosphatase [Gammaproteobacteria bacterium]